MKDLIKFSNQQLNINADEEYLHFHLQDKFEFKISFALILEIGNHILDKMQKRNKNS